MYFQRAAYFFRVLTISLSFLFNSIAPTYAKDDDTIPEKELFEVCNKPDPDSPDFACKGFTGEDDKKYSVKCMKINIKNDPIPENDRTPCFSDMDCKTKYCSFFVDQDEGGGECKSPDKRVQDGPEALKVYPIKKFYEFALAGNNPTYNLKDLDPDNEDKVVKRKFVDEKSCEPTPEGNLCASGQCDVKSEQPMGHQGAPIGKCVPLKMCLPCTKRDKKPKSGYPCCTTMIPDPETGLCAAVPHVIGADILGIIMRESNAINKVGVKSETSPIAWDTLRPNLEEESCSTKDYTVKREDGTSEQLSVDDVKASIEIRKMFVMIFEFLHKFNPEVSPDSTWWGYPIINTSSPRSKVQYILSTRITDGNAKPCSRNGSNKHCGADSEIFPQGTFIMKRPFDVFGHFQKINSAMDAIGEIRFLSSLKRNIEKVRNLEEMEIIKTKPEDAQKAMLELQRKNMIRAAEATDMMSLSYLKAFEVLNSFYEKAGNDGGRFADGDMPERGKYYQLLWTLPDYDDPDSYGSTRKAAVNVTTGAFHRVGSWQEEHEETISSEEIEENRENDQLGSNAIYGVRSIHGTCKQRNDHEEMKEHYDEWEAETEGEVGVDREGTDRYCTGNRIYAEGFQKDGTFLGNWAKDRRESDPGELRENLNRSPSYLNVHPALDAYSHEEKAFYGYSEKRGLKYNFYLFTNDYGSYAYFPGDLELHLEKLDKIKNGERSIIEDYTAPPRSKEEVENASPPKPQSLTILEDILKPKLPLRGLYLFNRPDFFKNKDGTAKDPVPEIPSEDKISAQEELESFIKYVKKDVLTDDEKLKFKQLYQRNNPALWNVFELMTYSDTGAHPTMYGRHMTFLLTFVLLDLYAIYSVFSDSYVNTRKCFEENVLIPFNEKTKDQGEGVATGGGYSNQGQVQPDNGPKEEEQTGGRGDTDYTDNLRPLGSFGVSASFGNLTGAGGSLEDGKTPIESLSPRLRSAVLGNSAYMKKLKKADADFNKKYGNHFVGKKQSEMNNAFNKLLSNTMKGIKDSLNSATNGLLGGPAASSVDSPKISEPEKKSEATLSEHDQSLIKLGASRGKLVSGTSRSKGRSISSGPSQIMRERKKESINTRIGTSIFTAVSWAYLNHFYKKEMEQLQKKIKKNK